MAAGGALAASVAQILVDLYNRSRWHRILLNHWFSLTGKVVLKYPNK
jgi:hypothetical protein